MGETFINYEIFLTLVNGTSGFSIETVPLAPTPHRKLRRAAASAVESETINHKGGLCDLHAVFQ
jgi:hypothetical protein